MSQTISDRRDKYFELKKAKDEAIALLHKEQDKTDSLDERLGSLRGVIQVLAVNAKRFGLDETINRMNKIVLEAEASDQEAEDED